MRLVMDDLDVSDINQVFKEFFNEYEDEIIAHFSKMFPDSDMNTYEGGIHTWFGLGSVMLFELGLVPKIEYDHHKTIMTL